MKRLLILYILSAVITLQLRALEPSGTLPVLTIDTEGGAPIVDRENYLQAVLSLRLPEGVKVPDPSDPMIDLADPQPLQDVALQIRGRGNTTWENDAQKPYRLKFDKKTELLGMPANKHFSLVTGDGRVGLWLGPLIGMQIGRQVGFPWSPRIQPVEVVLNGSYEGMYLLIENIKIAKDRLNIYEQPDLNTDEATIPYGWLVEFDNNYDDCQIIIPERDGKDLWVTYKSPEELSQQQLDWLKTEFSDLTADLYAGEKDALARLDLVSLARFLTVSEVMNDVEAYSGSQYLYRDKPTEALPTAPWQFGPLWDIELLHHPKKAWIINDPYWSRLNWIPALMQYPEVWAAFRDRWHEFYPAQFEQLPAFIHRMADYCAKADARSIERWPGVHTFPDITAAEKADWCVNRLQENAVWIAYHIDQGLSADLVTEDPSAPAQIFTLQGLPVATIAASISDSSVSAGSVANPSAEFSSLKAALSSLPSGIYIVVAPGSPARKITIP